jgi:hypothetical protein
MTFVQLVAKNSVAAILALSFAFIAPDSASLAPGWTFSLSGIVAARAE